MRSLLLHCWWAWLAFTYWSLYWSLVAPTSMAVRMMLLVPRYILKRVGQVAISTFRLRRTGVQEKVYDQAPTGDQQATTTQLQRLQQEVQEQKMEIQELCMQLQASKAQKKATCSKYKLARKLNQELEVALQDMDAMLKADAAMKAKARHAVQWSAKQGSVNTTLFTMEASPATTFIWPSDQPAPVSLAPAFPSTGPSATSLQATACSNTHPQGLLVLGQDHLVTQQPAALQPPLSPLHPQDCTSQEQPASRARQHSGDGSQASKQQQGTLPSPALPRLTVPWSTHLAAVTALGFLRRLSCALAALHRTISVGGQGGRGHALAGPGLGAPGSFSASTGTGLCWVVLLVYALWLLRLLPRNRLVGGAVQASCWVVVGFLGHSVMLVQHELQGRRA
ncbi:hypothetical protein V8C86DRAFT_2726470 [Haematococcus lacustris]